MSELVRKKEIVEIAAEATGVSKAKTSQILDAIIDAVRGKILDGDSVYISGLINLKAVQRPARAARNPSTGEIIHISTHKGVKAAVAKDLLDDLRRK